MALKSIQNCTNTTLKLVYWLGERWPRAGVHRARRLCMRFLWVRPANRRGRACSLAGQRRVESSECRRDSREI